MGGPGPPRSRRGGGPWYDGAEVDNLRVHARCAPHRSRRPAAPSFTVTGVNRIAIGISSGFDFSANGYRSPEAVPPVVGDVVGVGCADGRRDVVLGVGRVEGTCITRSIDHIWPRPSQTSSNGPKYTNSISTSGGSASSVTTYRKDGRTISRCPRMVHSSLAAKGRARSRGLTKPMRSERGAIRSGQARQGLRRGRGLEDGQQVRSARLGLAHRHLASAGPPPRRRGRTGRATHIGRHGCTRARARGHLATGRGLVLSANQKQTPKTHRREMPPSAQAHA